MIIVAYRFITESKEVAPTNEFGLIFHEQGQCPTSDRLNMLGLVFSEYRARVEGRECSGSTVLSELDALKAYLKKEGFEAK
jgi:hypothetical protein